MSYITFVFLSMCNCVYRLLFLFQKSSLGSALYEKVLYHLDITETDYFGLLYSDTSDVNVSHSLLAIHHLCFYDKTLLHESIHSEFSLVDFL